MVVESYYPDRSESLPGTVDLFIQRHHLLNALPLHQDGVITDTITFSSGQWARYRFVPNSLNVKSMQGKGPEGPFTQVTLQFEIAGDNQSLFEAMRKLRAGRYVVLFRSNTGQLQLMGDNDHWAEIKVDQANDSRFNGYRIEFKLKHPYGLYHYNGVVVGHSPVYFNINEDLELEADTTPDPLLLPSLNADGDLILNGPNAAHYSLDTDGNLIYNP